MALWQFAGFDWL